MHQIQLNIIPFKPVVDNQTFAFYGEKQKGFAPIYWARSYESFPKSARSILVKKLSNINWEGVSQLNLPVTIKYPEMVAEIYPYFQHEKLSPFGQESLWFL